MLAWKGKIPHNQTWGKNTHEHRLIQEMHKHLFFTAVILWAKINPVLYLKLMLRGVVMLLRTWGDSHSLQNSCCSFRNGNPICAQEAVKTRLTATLRWVYWFTLQELPWQVQHRTFVQHFTIHECDQTPTRVNMDRRVDSRIRAVNML